MKDLSHFHQQPDFSISFPSQTLWLRMAVDLTRHMATLAQFDSTAVQKIALALDEAVTNVIKHSYQNREDQEISIEYYLLGDAIKIRIIYAGIPPDLLKEEINLERMIKKRQKGGLGVELMKKIMDSVEYRLVEGKNVCEMIKWQSPV